MYHTSHEQFEGGMHTVMDLKGAEVSLLREAQQAQEQAQERD